MIEKLIGLNDNKNDGDAQDFDQYIDRDWNVRLIELLTVAFSKHFFGFNKFYDSTNPLRIHTSKYNFEQFKQVIKVDNINEADLLIVDKIYEPCKIPQIQFKIMTGHEPQKNQSLYFTCFSDILLIYYDPLNMNELSLDNIPNIAINGWDIVSKWDVENKDDNDYGECSLVEDYSESESESPGILGLPQLK